MQDELFGKEIEIRFYDLNLETAKRVFEKTYLEALRLQRVFNFFDDGSELSKLNRKRKAKVSKDLLNVITDSLKFSEMTKGEYDITLGKRILNRKKGKKDIRISSSYRDVLVEGDRIKLKNKDATIDLGSIAKGFITDKLSELIKKEGVKEFIINSRGDLVFSGCMTHIIGIANPRNKKKNIHLIKMKDKAVATSGDYNQYYKEYKKSHILNQKDVISATVIAGTLEEADVLSTAIFVSDEKIRRRIIMENPEAKFFLVKEDLSEEMHNGFEEAIYE